MKKIQHYYGNIVRIFFFIGAAIMLISLPFINNKIDIPVTISLSAIILLALFAGLTNPRQIWISIINVAISVVALLVFEYFAITFYVQYPEDKLFFFINQILAINFLFALYYSSKTLRGYYTKEVRFTEDK